MELELELELELGLVLDLVLELVLELELGLVLELELEFFICFLFYPIPLLSKSFIIVFKSLFFVSITCIIFDRAYYTDNFVVPYTYRIFSTSIVIVLTVSSNNLSWYYITYDAIYT